MCLDVYEMYCLFSLLSLRRGLNFAPDNIENLTHTYREICNMVTSLEQPVKRSLTWIDTLLESLMFVFCLCIINLIIKWYAYLGSVLVEICWLFVGERECPDGHDGVDVVADPGMGVPLVVGR